MMIEIANAIWLQTPRGLALAKFVIDRGIDSDLEWVCFQHDTGECWTYLNSGVRIAENITLGRTKLSPIRRQPMPWTARDASSKTKKAKSPGAKKQWAAVADKVLAKTGDEGRAVRTANAAVKRRKRK